MKSLSEDFSNYPDMQPAEIDYKGINHWFEFKISFNLVRDYFRLKVKGNFGYI